MPEALRTRPCEECGETLSTAHKATRTHPGECAYKFRTRRVLTANVSKRATEPQVVWEPRTREPLVGHVTAQRGPLVPLIGSVHGNVNTVKPVSVRSRTHLIIPDVQAHDGAPTQHLEWVGKYIAAKRPDVIVCIGDFADLPSLCSYDKGKKSFEGRRYVNDIEAAREAMELLVSQFRDIPGYKPRMVLTLGNHEDRITRAVEDAAILEGAIGLHDLGYEAMGWEVHPFLEIVKIDGIEYSHYFTTGVMGRPVTSAAALLRVRQCSAVMGHTQATDVSFHPKTQAIGIFAGTCYLHDEPYLGLQGNNQRRQIVMLYEVADGHFDPLFISLGYLRRRYGS
jgi:hypothetical protein